MQSARTRRFPHESASAPAAGPGPGGCVGYGGAVYTGGGYYGSPGYYGYGGYPYYGSTSVYVAPAPRGYYGGGYRDRDRDGVPNRWDRDRDGDGVRNRGDRFPNDPRRQ